MTDNEQYQKLQKYAAKRMQDYYEENETTLADQIGNYAEHEADDITRNKGGVLLANANQNKNIIGMQNVDEDEIGAEAGVILYKMSEGFASIYQENSEKVGHEHAMALAKSWQDNVLQGLMYNPETKTEDRQRFASTFSSFGVINKNGEIGYTTNGKFRTSYLDRNIDRVTVSDVKSHQLADFTLAGDFAWDSLNWITDNNYRRDIYDDVLIDNTMHTDPSAIEKYQAGVILQGVGIALAVAEGIALGSITAGLGGMKALSTGAKFVNLANKGRILSTTSTILQPVIKGWYSDSTENSGAKKQYWGGTGKLYGDMKSHWGEFAMSRTKDFAVGILGSVGGAYAEAQTASLIASGISNKATALALGTIGGNVADIGTDMALDIIAHNALVSAFGTTDNKVFTRADRDMFDLDKLQLTSIIGNRIAGKVMGNAISNIRAKTEYAKTIDSDKRDLLMSSDWHVNNFKDSGTFAKVVNSGLLRIARTVGSSNFADLDRIIKSMDQDESLLTILKNPKTNVRASLANRYLSVEASKNYLLDKLFHSTGSINMGFFKKQRDIALSPANILPVLQEIIGSQNASRFKENITDTQTNKIVDTMIEHIDGYFEKDADGKVTLKAGETKDTVMKALFNVKAFMTKQYDFIGAEELEKSIFNRYYNRLSNEVFGYNQDLLPLNKFAQSLEMGMDDGAGDYIKNNILEDNDRYKLEQEFNPVVKDITTFGTMSTKAQRESANAYIKENGLEAAFTETDRLINSAEDTDAISHYLLTKGREDVNGIIGEFLTVLKDGEIKTDADFIEIQRQMNTAAPKLVEHLLKNIEDIMGKSVDVTNPNAISPDSKAKRLFVQILKLQHASLTFGAKITGTMQAWKAKHADSKLFEEISKINKEIIANFQEEKVKNDTNIQKNMLEHIVDNSISRGVLSMVNLQKINHLLGDDNASFLMNATELLRISGEYVDTDHIANKANTIIMNAQLEATSPFFRGDSSKAYSTTKINGRDISDADENVANGNLVKLSSDASSAVPNSEVKNVISQTDMSTLLGLAMRKKIANSALDYAQMAKEAKDLHGGRRGPLAESFHDFALRKLKEDFHMFPSDMIDKMEASGAYLDIIKTTMGSVLGGRAPRVDNYGLANEEGTSGDNTTFVLKTMIDHLSTEEYIAFATKYNQELSSLAGGVIAKTYRLKSNKAWSNLSDPADAALITSKTIYDPFIIRGSKSFDTKGLIDEIEQNHPAKNIDGDLTTIVESTFSMGIAKQSNKSGLDTAVDRIKVYLTKVAPDLTNDLSSQELHRLGLSIALIKNDHQEVAVSTFISSMPLKNMGITTSKDAVLGLNNIFRGGYYSVRSVGTDREEGLSGIAPSELLESYGLVQLFPASSTLESTLVEIPYWKGESTRKNISNLVSAVHERFAGEPTPPGDLVSRSEHTAFLQALKDVYEGGEGDRAETTIDATKKLYKIVGDYLILKNDRLTKWFSEGKTPVKLPDGKSKKIGGYDRDDVRRVSQTALQADISSLVTQIKVFNPDYKVPKKVTDVIGDVMIAETPESTIKDLVAELSTSIAKVKTNTKMVLDNTAINNINDTFKIFEKNLWAIMSPEKNDRALTAKILSDVGGEINAETGQMYHDLTKAQMDEIVNEAIGDSWDSGKNVYNSALAVGLTKLKVQRATLDKWLKDVNNITTDMPTVLKWGYSLASYGQLLMQADYVPKRGASMGIASPIKGQEDALLSKLYDESKSKVTTPRLIIISSKSFEGDDPGDGVMQLPQWLYNYYNGLSGGVGGKVNVTMMGTLLKIMAQTNKKMVQDKLNIIDQDGNATVVGKNDIVINTSNIKSMSPEFLVSFGLTADNIKNMESGTALVAKNDKFVKDFVLSINRHSDFSSLAKDINLSTQQANTDKMWGHLYKALYKSDTFKSEIDKSLSKVGKLDVLKDPNKWVSQLQSILRRGVKANGGLTIAMPQETLNSNLDVIYSNKYKNKTSQENEILNNVVYSHNYLVSTIDEFSRTDAYKNGNVIHNGKPLDKDLYELGRAIHRNMVNEDKDIGEMNTTEFGRNYYSSLTDKQKASYNKLTDETRTKLLNGSLMLDMMSDPENGFIIKDTDSDGNPAYMVLSTRFPAQNKAQTQFFVISGIRRANVHEGIELGTFYYAKMMKGDWDGDRPMITHAPSNFVRQAFKGAYKDKANQIDDKGGLFHAIMEKAYADTSSIFLESTGSHVTVTAPKFTNVLNEVIANKALAVGIGIERGNLAQFYQMFLDSDYNNHMLSKVLKEIVDSVNGEESTFKSPNRVVERTLQHRTEYNSNPKETDNYMLVDNYSDDKKVDIKYHGSFKYAVEGKNIIHVKRTDGKTKNELGFFNKTKVAVALSRATGKDDAGNTVTGYKYRIMILGNESERQDYGQEDFLENVKAIVESNFIPGTMESVVQDGKMKMYQVARELEDVFSKATDETSLQKTMDELVHSGLTENYGITKMTAHEMAQPGKGKGLRFGNYATLYGQVQNTPTDQAKLLGALYMYTKYGAHKGSRTYVETLDALFGGMYASRFAHIEDLKVFDGRIKSTNDLFGLRDDPTIKVKWETDKKADQLNNHNIISKVLSRMQMGTGQLPSMKDYTQMMKLQKKSSIEPKDLAQALASANSFISFANSFGDERIPPGALQVIKFVRATIDSQPFNSDEKAKKYIKNFEKDRGMFFETGELNNYMPKYQDITIGDKTFSWSPLHIAYELNEKLKQVVGTFSGNGYNGSAVLELYQTLLMRQGLNTDANYTSEPMIIKAIVKAVANKGYAVSDADVRELIERIPQAPSVGAGKRWAFRETTISADLGDIATKMVKAGAGKEFDAFLAATEVSNLKENTSNIFSLKDLDGNKITVEEFVKGADNYLAFLNSSSGRKGYAKAGKPDIVKANAILQGISSIVVPQAQALINLRASGIDETFVKLALKENPDSANSFKFSYETLEAIMKQSTVARKSMFSLSPGDLSETVRRASEQKCD